MDSKEKDFNKIMKNKSYSMTYVCPNCGEHFSETFRFGEVASQGVCPHCGVSPEQIKREVPRLR